MSKLGVWQFYNGNEWVIGVNAEHRRETEKVLIPTCDLYTIDHAEALAKLLEISKCPNSECLEGAIPHQIGDGTEWTVEQCQWCDETINALLAYKEGVK